MAKFRTHYDNLQVKETASEEVIRGAYRYLSQKWHPDKNIDNKEEAERVLKIINQAYDVLSDPDRRRQHDAWIRQQRERYSEAQQSPPPSPPPSATTQEQEEDEPATSLPRVRPWIRFWARFIDIHLFGFAFVVALLIVNPYGYVFMENEYTLGVVVMFVWVFFEALLLATIGTTPGKWLLSININHPSDRISLDDALSRSFKVWWRGLGTGFPIATIITQVLAYRNLASNGECSWDADHDLVVTHEKITTGRLIVSCLIVFVAFFFIFIPRV